MKKLILSFLLASCFAACKTKSVDPVTKSTEEYLALNNWKLNRYTDTSNKTLSASALNTSAQALLSLNFIFTADGVTKAIEPASKTIVNRGTWGLNADKSVMNINITAFNGDFKIITVNQNQLILQTKTTGLISNTDPLINMEFSPAQ